MQASTVFSMLVNCVCVRYFVRVVNSFAVDSTGNATHERLRGCPLKTGRKERLKVYLWKSTYATMISYREGQCRDSY